MPHQQDLYLIIYYVFFQAVDFSTAIYQSVDRLYMQRPTQSVKWTTFVEVFHLDYWLALLAVTIFIIFGTNIFFRLAGQQVVFFWDFMKYTTNIL